jgi:hypothetical protein
LVARTSQQKSFIGISLTGENGNARYALSPSYTHHTSKINSVYGSPLISRSVRSKATASRPSDFAAAVKVSAALFCSARSVPSNSLTRLAISCAPRNEYARNLGKSSVRYSPCQRLAHAIHHKTEGETGTSHGELNRIAVGQLDNRRDPFIGKSFRDTRIDPLKLFQLAFGLFIGVSSEVQRTSSEPAGGSGSV